MVLWHVRWEGWANSIGFYKGALLPNVSILQKWFLVILPSTGILERAGKHSVANWSAVGQVRSTRLLCRVRMSLTIVDEDQQYERERHKTIYSRASNNFEATNMSRIKRYLWYWRERESCPPGLIIFFWADHFLGMSTPPRSKYDNITSLIRF